MNERNPLLSRLVLATEKQGLTPDEVDLGAGDLVGQRLTRTKLVVLSACQTGGERYYNGEGLIGMSRAFLETGIPLVVASQWPVESHSTSQLMIKFHRYRKTTGLSTIQALHRAQQELLGDQGGVYHDPYYWAAFQVIGGLADF